MFFGNGFCDCHSAAAVVFSVRKHTHTPHAPPDTSSTHSIKSTRVRNCRNEERVVSVCFSISIVSQHKI